MMQIISRQSDRTLAGARVRHEEQTFHDMEGRLRAANESLAGAVFAKLISHYDNPFWNVEAAHEHGIVKIWLQGFAQWPYIVHIATLKSDPKMKCVVKAGGELLERFRIPRSSFSVADYVRATRAMPHAYFRNKRAPE